MKKLAPDWHAGLSACRRRTDGDRLDLDALFDVSIIGVVRVLMGEHSLAAECVDESGAT